MKAYEVALKEVGVKEVQGKGSNPRILEYFKDLNIEWEDDSTIAWCKIFANWCLLKAGLPYNKSLAARSGLKLGTPVDEPELGDLVIFWRGSKDGWQGHIFFFLSQTDTHVWGVGGNQHNSVDVSKYAKSRVLGYRRI